MKRFLIQFAIIVALAVTTVACKQQPMPIDPEHVAAKINRSLPKPYVDGLVTQHAHAEGKQLVVDIRIPYATAAQMNPKKLPFLRIQEQGDLNIAACRDPDLKALMDSHYGVSRRFLDRDGKQVFELAAMKAPNCKLFQ